MGSFTNVEHNGRQRYILIMFYHMDTTILQTSFKNHCFVTVHQEPPQQHRLTKGWKVISQSWNCSSCGDREHISLKSCVSCLEPSGLILSNSKNLLQEKGNAANYACSSRRGQPSNQHRSVTPQVIWMLLCCHPCTKQNHVSQQNLNKPKNASSPMVLEIHHFSGYLLNCAPKWKTKEKTSNNIKNNSCFNKLFL